MIKRFRERFKLNQEQAARLLGVTQPSISNYEKGVYPIPLPVRHLITIYTIHPGIVGWMEAHLR